MNSDSLFDQVQGNQSRQLVDSPSEESTHYFYTNRFNLADILSCGLVRPLEAYAKVYTDPNVLVKGGVLLFPEHVSASFLSEFQESEMSFPVCLKLLLPQLEGLMVWVDRDYQIKSVPNSRPPEGLLALIIQGAISTQHVKEIIFRHQDERDEFTAREFENVPHLAIPTRIAPEVFDGKAIDLSRLREGVSALNSAKRSEPICSWRALDSIAAVGAAEDRRMADDGARGSKITSLKIICQMFEEFSEPSFSRIQEAFENVPVAGIPKDWPLWAYLSIPSISLQSGNVKNLAGYLKASGAGKVSTELLEELKLWTLCIQEVVSRTTQDRDFPDYLHSVESKFKTVLGPRGKRNQAIAAAFEIVNGILEARIEIARLLDLGTISGALKAFSMFMLRSDHSIAGSWAAEQKKGLVTEEDVRRAVVLSSAWTGYSMLERESKKNSNLFYAGLERFLLNAGLGVARSYPKLQPTAKRGLAKEVSDVMIISGLYGFEMPLKVVGSYETFLADLSRAKLPAHTEPWIQLQEHVNLRPYLFYKTIFQDGNHALTYKISRGELTTIDKPVTSTEINFNKFVADLTSGQLKINWESLPVELRQDLQQSLQK